MTHPNPSLAALLETAIAAATAGGNHAMRNRHRRGEVVQSYAHDVKLVLDVECQRVVETLVSARFPDHQFLGEEDQTEIDGQRLGANRNAPDDDTLQWIIDPIDGTVNFASGLPVWCCSVAVRRRGTVLAGAVYAPMLNAIYAATTESPATCNGEPIHVSDRRTLAESVVMTGMDKNLAPGIPPLACFERIVNHCRKARIVGSAAVDLCWVAQGGADGYFEGSIYLWDIAAAGLIARQAGATTEVLANREDPYQLSFIATNGHIHAALKAILPPGIAGDKGIAGDSKNV
jgi:myo-inositol-1(or 4)-monophosphatase